MSYDDIVQYTKRKYRRINKGTKRKFEKLNKEKLKKEEKNRVEANQRFIELLRGEKVRENFPTSVKNKELELCRRKCRRCHKSLIPHAYQFHHRDFNHSNKSQNNCRAVCSGCHQQITYDKIKIP